MPAIVLMVGPLVLARAAASFAPGDPGFRVPGVPPRAHHSIACRIDPDQGLRQFCAIVWQGHLPDLLGRREEAAGKYTEALERDTGRTVRHDQDGMKLDRAWVQHVSARRFGVDEVVSAAFRG
jgi:hypothetical protein